MSQTTNMGKKQTFAELLYQRRVVAGNIIAFVGFLLIWIDPYAAITTPRLLIGMVLGVAGFSLRIWASGYQWQNIASPLPDARSGLITAGPYAYVRHPIYLSMLLLTCGIFITFGSWIVALTVVLATFALNFWQSKYEDTFLREKHGAFAQQYQAHVPRFFPKFWAPFPTQNGVFSLAQGFKYDIGPLSAFVCFCAVMLGISVSAPPTLLTTLFVLVGSVLFSFLLTWLVRQFFKHEFS